ncbi:tRNA (cytidine(34)-2'-O)-methyltransferase [Desulfovibrio inopinatus]|uniref:tRNA (cytidine(34)-2'-O)-methyltransferase n=1 Tax=Desulfovibrio inopinatus TaxID=102109 RepID=UPI00048181C2|nr:tRNA (cytidine(34)-2'-O)-methyltransferase [Desulfovibrio inopinatus]
MPCIVLYEPEIPPNTGSIARLCAATRIPLHLIEPLGFKLEDKYLKRAGLDYWPHVNLSVWPDFSAFAKANAHLRFVATTSQHRGHGAVPYHKFAYQENDALLFGAESKGLPESFLTDPTQCIAIPIFGEVRSLNLANAASIILYESLRQLGTLNSHIG